MKFKRKKLPIFKVFNFLLVKRKMKRKNNYSSMKKQFLFYILAINLNGT